MTERIFSDESGDYVALGDDGEVTGRAASDSLLADLLRFAGVSAVPAAVSPRFPYWLQGIRPDFEVLPSASSRLFPLSAPMSVNVLELLGDIDGRGFELLVTTGASEPKFAALDAVAPEGFVFTRHSSLLFAAKLTDGSRSVLVSVSVMGAIVDAIVDRDSRAGWDLLSDLRVGSRSIGQPTLIRDPPDAVRVARLSRRPRTEWLERQLMMITGVDVGLIERRHVMRDPGVIPGSSTGRFSAAFARLYGALGAREAMFVLDESASVAGGHFARHVSSLLDDWQVREPLGLRFSTPAIMNLLERRVRASVSREEILARETWGDDE